MQFITRPIEKWPRPETRPRKRGPYSLPFDRMLRHLDYELRKLGVDGDVVLQIDVKEHEIRRDGLPYADRRPATPRVAIAFTCKHGPLTYYCDKFVEWQQNVRAVGLGLDRLRLVEETGIVSRGEQYTGFKALPASIEMGDGMTLEDALAFVANESNSDVHPLSYRAAGGEELFATHYKLAAKRLHQDVGGHPDDWNRLQRAKEIADKYFAEAR